MRIALGLLLALSTVSAQDTPEAHIAAAKAAAGDDFRTCSSSNATGRAPEDRAQRRERLLDQVAARVVDHEQAGSGRRDRRIDPRGISNR